MPVESVRKYKYGFVLMDNYSRASWVLLLRAKSDAPTECEKWVNLMENRANKKVRTVMFDNAKELVAGRMRELRDERCNTYSPSSNGVATNGTRVMLQDSGLPPRFWAGAIAVFMYLRNRTPAATNEGMSSSIG